MLHESPTDCASLCVAAAAADQIGDDKRKWKIFDGKSQMLIGGEPISIIIIITIIASFLEEKIAHQKRDKST